MPSALVERPGVGCGKGVSVGKGVIVGTGVLVGIAVGVWEGVHVAGFKSGVSKPGGNGVVVGRGVLVKVCVTVGGITGALVGNGSSDVHPTSTKVTITMIRFMRGLLSQFHN